MTALIVLSGFIAPAAKPQSTAGLSAYDVELVIFRVLSPDATAEQWDMEAAAAGQRLAIPDDEQSPFAAAPAAPAPTTTASFPTLPPSRLKLTAIEEALRRSRKYQPLAHVGWTQPGYPRDAAQYLPLNAVVPEAAGLLGQVALSRGRYLHLTLDLVYQAPAVDGVGAQRYVLRQTRRMRSNERHYIDHPMFGVIALVSPADEKAR